MFPRLQKLDDVVTRRFKAAHDLGDDRYRVVAEYVSNVGCEDPALGREGTLFRRIAHECPYDPQAMSRRTLDVVGAFGQQPVDGGADGAVPEQGNRNVDGTHLAG